MIFFLKIKENILGIKVQYVKGIILGKSLKEIANAQQHALNIHNTVKNGNDIIIKKYNTLLRK